MANPLMKSVSWIPQGVGRVGATGLPAPPAPSGMGGLLGGMATVPPPPPAPPPGQAVPPPEVPPGQVNLAGKQFTRPGIMINPDILKLIPLLTVPKTTTQLAQSAIQQLSSASPDAIREALNTVRNKNIAAPNLMNYLERKVIIGEVLNEMARDWAAQTKQDFAEAFQTSPDRLDVMDSIVSFAVLNDKDLEGELRAENTAAPTQQDLMENRKVVWQYPPPGTVLQPPYIVLVAVENAETAKADEVVQSILGSLVDYQGFKIPQAAVKKL